MMIESRMLHFARTLSGLVLLAGTAGAAGCVDRVDTAVLSCPCASGYVCCESGVCATDATGCSAATAALSASIAGQWTGYIENLAGGDDALRIDIVVGDDGELSGQVRIGSGTPPAPATDGTLPWPASIDHGIDTVPPTYISGFSYTAHDMSWHAKRLKILIPNHEPWQPWCALQQTHATPDGYRCYPGGDFQFSDLGMTAPKLDAAGNCLIDTDTDPDVVVLASIGCGQYAMCDTVKACVCTSSGCNCGGNGVCECDATGCHAGSTWMSVPIGYWLDLAFDEPDADGSLNLSAGGNELHNVRLMRASEVH